VCDFDYTSSDGGLEIQHNKALDSLRGVETITQVGFLYILSNDRLTDLSALSRVESLGFVVIADIPATTLAPLAGCQTAGSSSR
jgi:hypothetical protein